MGESLIYIVFILILMFFIGVLRFLSGNENTEHRVKKPVTSRTFIENTYNSISGVVGLAKPPLTGPFSGRPCACYEVIVEECRTDSDNSDYWVIIFHVMRGRDFYLEDQDGRAYVEMRNADVSLELDRIFKSKSFNDDRKILRKFLAGHGKEIEMRKYARKLRFKEGVLAKGGWVEVRGQGIYKLQPERPLDPPLLLIRGAANMPLYVRNRV